MGVGLGVAVLSDGIGAGLAVFSLGIGVRAADELSVACRSSSADLGPHAADTRVAIVNTSTTSQGNIRFGIKGPQTRMTKKDDYLLDVSDMIRLQTGPRFNLYADD